MKTKASYTYNYEKSGYKKKKLDKGAAVQNLCEVYGVGTSTIIQLLKFFAKSDITKGISEHKTLRSANSVDHDNIHYANDIVKVCLFLDQYL